MDWDPADIVAALHKRGWSLRQLSFAHGYRANALKHALRRPYPRAERIIAEALGLEPARIWPSRYPLPGGNRGAPREGDQPVPVAHGDKRDGNNPST